MVLGGFTISCSGPTISRSDPTISFRKKINSFPRKIRISINSEVDSDIKIWRRKQKLCNSSPTVCGLDRSNTLGNGYLFCVCTTYTNSTTDPIQGTCAITALCQQGLLTADQCTCCRCKFMSAQRDPGQCRIWHQYEFTTAQHDSGQLWIWHQRVILLAGNLDNYARAWKLR